MPRLRPVSLVLLAALASCSDAGKEAVVAPAPEPALYRNLAETGAEVDAAGAREMISLYRRNNGLAPLTLDPRLQEAARARADVMARAGSLDPSVRGPLRDHLAAAGVMGSRAVENVSAGYHTLAEAFSGWRQSRPHNAKMLDSRATRMGLATAYAPDKKYKVYWALILAE